MCALISLLFVGVVLFGVVSAVGHILFWALVLAVVARVLCGRDK